MIKLSNVTLCAVDCVNPYLALTALIESAKDIEFNSVILFSNIKPNNIPENIKFIYISKISNLVDYSKFIIKDLYNYTNTDYVLNIQSDGYIHNSKGWINEFLQWDYVGAPWQSTEHFVTSDCRVGNGGVSLRSRNLLRELQYIQFPEMHEDVFIGVVAKKYLETRGIKIAPLNIAAKFSVEKLCADIDINPYKDCFAFHGKTYSDFHTKKIKYLQKKALKKYPYMNINTIETKYNLKKNTPSDINEHMHTLFMYALKCETIAEFGVRNVTSSYAFAHAKPKELLCLDIDDNSFVKTFINECKEENINASFVHASSLEYDLTHNYDLLFIDTLHTFNQLTKELEKHHSKINKYIIFHDTVFWGYKNENPIDSSDTGERGNNVGLVPAIGNFLKKHQEWKEICTFTNNNGLTIIERI